MCEPSKNSAVLNQYLEDSLAHVLDDPHVIRFWWRAGDRARMDCRMPFRRRACAESFPHFAAVITSVATHSNPGSGGVVPSSLTGHLLDTKVIFISSFEPAGTKGVLWFTLKNLVNLHLVRKKTYYFEVPEPFCPIP